MSLQDRVKNIPTWAYAAGGVLIVGLAFMMTRDSGSKGSYSSPEIPATDINDLMNDLQDALDNLREGDQTDSGPSTPPSTQPPTGTTPVTALWASGKFMPDWVKKFDSNQMAALMRHYKIDYGKTISFAEIRKLFKRSGVRYGKTINQKDFLKLGITKVQTSNNQVT